MNLLYKIVCIVFLSVWGTIYSSAYKVNGIYYRLDTKTGWLYIIKSEDPGGYKGKSKLLLQKRLQEQNVLSQTLTMMLL